MRPEDNDLDRILSGIRDEEVDPATIETAAARVRARLEHTTLRSCADFQALAPDYRAGRLSEARALLFEDHTRNCLACRKAVAHQASPETKVLPFARPRRITATPWLRWALAAGVAFIAVLAGWNLYDAFLSGGGRTVILAANGPVYRVSAGGAVVLAQGAELTGTGEISTGKDAGAVVKLSDGSVVEMRERSALSASRSGRDLTVHLPRGSIIVQAAKRRSGHLYVAARDCRVAVTGTVFSVNSGVKGSRVSVIEGEVRVAQGGQEKVLHPGEQYATTGAIAPVPVADEIAWSRNATQHLALLREFSVLQKQLEQVRMPDLRYSTRLAQMLPADTVVYAAIPNLARAVAEARDIVRQRAAESPVLRQWWDEKMAGGKGVDLLDELRSLGDFLGDEIVIAAQTGADGRVGSPVILAEVRKTGLGEHIRARMENAGAHGGLRIADSLDALASATGQPVIFLRQDLAAISPDPAALRKALSGGGFLSTPFGARVADSYRDGAGFVFAADLEKIVPKTPAGHHEDRAGFSDLKYAVVEQRQAAGRTDTAAVLAFRGPRQGVASLLGKPATIGALDYISPEAGFAAGFTVISPAALFDQLAPAGDESLAKAEAELGLKFRDDLLASFGNEIAFALDGPALPTPAWKVIAEVRDASRLQFAIQKIVEAAGRTAAANGKAAPQLSLEAVSGRTWYHLAAPGIGSAGEACYTYADGYLVAAPTRALAEQALGYRASGYSLTRSQAFAALLPRDRYADFSGMVYQNMGGTLGPVVQMLGGSKALDPAQKKAMEGIAGELSKPMLVTFYGEEDRIVVASTGSTLALTPANLMRLASPMAFLNGTHVAHLAHGAASR